MVMCCAQNQHQATAMHAYVMAHKKSLGLRFGLMTWLRIKVRVSVC